MQTLRVPVTLTAWHQSPVLHRANTVHPGSGGRGPALCLASCEGGRSRRRVERCADTAVVQTGASEREEGFSSAPELGDSPTGSSSLALRASQTGAHATTGTRAMGSEQPNEGW